MSEKCLYSKFFWSVFSLIQTEYGESYLSLFSTNTGNMDQKNSEYGHFLRAVCQESHYTIIPISLDKPRIQGP